MDTNKREQESKGKKAAKLRELLNGLTYKEIEELFSYTFDLIKEQCPIITLYSQET